MVILMKLNFQFRTFVVKWIKINEKYVIPNEINEINQ